MDWESQSKYCTLSKEPAGPSPDGAGYVGDETRILGECSRESFLASG